MRGARLIALPLVLLAGILLALGVGACGDEKKDRRKPRTKTVTVQEKQTPTSPTGQMSPKEAKKAAAAGQVPPGADASDLAAAQGAGGIPAGAAPPSGGIPPGAIPSGGIPPGAIPSGSGPTGFEIPDRVRVKVDSSRRVSRTYDLCRQNRQICGAIDNVNEAFR
jgi:hypothetical protein